jgi:hypothetical protein
LEIGKKPGERFIALVIGPGITVNDEVSLAQ